jgi:hypothetical protein
VVVRPFVLAVLASRPREVVLGAGFALAGAELPLQPEHLLQIAQRVRMLPGDAMRYTASAQDSCLRPVPRETGRSQRP